MTAATLTTISSETDFDIVVVGAGILGISSAYHLKKNNPHKIILVIDRYDEVGQGNTGRSNAMFRNTFTSVDNQILTDSSIDFYLDTQNLNADIGVDVIGYLWVMSDRQLSTSRQHIEKMKDNGIELRFYDREQLGRAIPGLTTRLVSEQARLMDLEDIAGAFLGVKCGRLAPDRLAGFYRDRFRELGGLTSFRTEAKRLLFGAQKSVGIDGEPFVWQEAEVTGVETTDHRDLRAKAVVVAGGAWNNELLDAAGIDGHVKAKKRQLFALATRGSDALRDLLWLKGFNKSGTLPFVILPKSGLFVKPVKENSEFWVGCEDEINRPFIALPDHDLDTYRAEPAYYEMNIHQTLRQYLPAFERSEPTSMWAGLYAYNTLDNMPYVFAEHGLIAVGGDSGSGVMKADSLGRIVDAVYREGESARAQLYGSRTYQASRMGFRSRKVEREEWVL